MELDANPDIHYKQNESPCKLYSAGLECGALRASQGGEVIKIVAAGGRDSGGWPASKKVEIYDITANTWDPGGTFLHFWQHMCTFISKTRGNGPTETCGNELCEIIMLGGIHLLRSQNFRDFGPPPPLVRSFTQPISLIIRKIGHFLHPPPSVRT